MRVLRRKHHADGGHRMHAACAPHRPLGHRFCACLAGLLSTRTITRLCRAAWMALVMPRQSAVQLRRVLRCVPKPRISHRLQLVHVAGASRHLLLTIVPRRVLAHWVASYNAGACKRKMTSTGHRLSGVLQDRTVYSRQQICLQTSAPPLQLRHRPLRSVQPLSIVSLRV